MLQLLSAFIAGHNDLEVILTEAGELISQRVETMNSVFGVQG